MCIRDRIKADQDVAEAGRRALDNRAYQILYVELARQGVAGDFQKFQFFGLARQLVHQGCCSVILGHSSLVKGLRLLAEAFAQGGIVDLLDGLPEVFKTR